MGRYKCAGGNRGQVSLFIVIGLVIVISVGILYYYDYMYNGNGNTHTIKLDFCAGDIALGSCSNDKPGFCSYDVESDGPELIEDCSRCGCPEGLACTGSICEEIDNTYAGFAEDKDNLTSDFKIFFVPMNYEPADVRFLLRVGEIKHELRSKLSIPESSFIIVDEMFNADAVCEIDLGAISIFAEDWYIKKNNKFLPARAMGDEDADDAETGIYWYRIIAVDKLLQEVGECGCGFTYLYGDSIYLGGQECSKQVNVADHEFGHTFGLCDEYDTCIWESTDKLMKCMNARPTKLDSDCGDSCCSLKSACCHGKYSDLGFNVMGSSDLPSERDFNYESLSVISNDLCASFGICGARE